MFGEFGDNGATTVLFHTPAQSFGLVADGGGTVTEVSAAIGM